MRRPRSFRRGSTCRQIGGFRARCDWLDYTVFSIYLLASLGIGIAFTRGQRSIKDYILTGRSMGPIVAAVTVPASLFSGISFLGTPSEVYVRGIGYWLIVLSGFVTAPMLNYVFIPVSYRVKYYSGRRNMVGRVRRMAVEDRWCLEEFAPAYRLAGNGPLGPTYGCELTARVDWRRQELPARIVVKIQSRDWWYEQDYSPRLRCGTQTDARSGS